MQHDNIAENRLTMTMMQIPGNIKLRRWGARILVLGVFFLVVSMVGITNRALCIVNGRATELQQWILSKPDKQLRKSEPISELKPMDNSRDGPITSLMSIPTDRLVSSRHVKPVSEHTPVYEDNVGNAPITSLIDMPLNFNYSHANRHIKYTILWYNPAKWIHRITKYVKLETCQYNNCVLTDDRRHLNRSAAVIFGINMQNMTNAPPVSQSQRDPNQIWIYLAREPPLLHRYFYNVSAWYNTMNWSISFNLDSDVAFPYGMFKTRPEPYTNEPDYGKIYDMKTKMAVWLVSNCHPKSRRQEFVVALQKAGIEVDIFGKCGDLGKRFYGHISDLVRPYKFYLSLENSFCKYYVTEKVTDRYNDDVIMLIRGGADYKHMIPNDTYVDAAKFPDVTSLANHLLDLSSNRTRYVEILRNKYKYHALGSEFTYPRAMCDLCRKLNTKGVATKTIFRPQEHNLEEGRCIDRRDIDIQ